MSTSRTIPSRRFNLLLIFGVLLTMFPLLVSDEVWDGFFEWFFSWVPAHPPARLEGLFGLIMMPFLWLHGFSYMIGTAICLWCAGRFMLRLPKPIVLPALLIPLLCDAYVFAQALPFLAVPSGAQIRPMGWAFYTLILALALTVIGFVYAVAQFRTQQNKVLCGIGMFLSLFPIPIAMSSLRLMAAIKGFELEP